MLIVLLLWQQFKKKKNTKEEGCSIPLFFRLTPVWLLPRVLNDTENQYRIPILSRDTTGTFDTADTAIHIRLKSIYQEGYSWKHKQDGALWSNPNCTDPHQIIWWELGFSFLAKTQLIIFKTNESVVLKGCLKGFKCFSSLKWTLKWTMIVVVVI